MSMSTYARRFGLVAVSGTVYVGAVYLGLQLYGGGHKCKECEDAITSGGGETKSYVFDPRRTATFQKIAYSYDDEISKDEFVMGINLLRRALLFFHAKGEVLEVGAGTGRNLGYYPGKSTVQKIVLSDSSDKMLARAIDKLSRMSQDEKERYQLLVADAARGLSGYLDKHAERHAKNWGCVWNRDIDDIIKSAGLLLEKVDTWHFGTTYYIVSRPSKI
eukprot:scaffold175221_cov35-Cyclotella_meneghiniana.AAC.2